MIMKHCTGSMYGQRSVGGVTVLSPNRPRVSRAGSGSALSDVDRHRIGSLSVDRERQSYFPTPPETVRDLNVDLIQPGKLALCTGENNRSRCSADRGANVGETAVLPEARPEQSE